MKKKLKDKDFDPMSLKSRVYLLSKNYLKIQELEVRQENTLNPNKMSLINAEMLQSYALLQLKIQCMVQIVNQSV